MRNDGNHVHDPHLPHKAVGHLRTVHPSQFELFCLRILLLHQKGCTPWNDIKAVDGVTHPTFKAACIALDLIESDKIWIETMDEACAAQLPSACRKLFVFILLECTPSEPRIVYEKYCDHMKRDFLHKHIHQDGYNPDEAEEFAANDLCCFLEKHFND